MSAGKFKIRILRVPEDVDNGLVEQAARKNCDVEDFLVDDLVKTHRTKTPRQLQLEAQRPDETTSIEDSREVARYLQIARKQLGRD